MYQNFKPTARFREIVLATALAQCAHGLDVEQRFPQLIGTERSAAKVFAGCKAVVVGVGSVGRRVALHLARLGIEVIWLVDPGRYDETANLVTQEITAADLNTAKATSTGEACKAISPDTRVLVYDGKVQDLNPVATADADVVFLATDNLAVEADVSSRFRALGIPLVQAAVHGETLVAQVRFVANATADGPCLLCGFGEDEWRHMNQSSVFSCSGANDGDGTSDIANDANGATEHVQIMPTMSTSFLCSLAADLALMQWARYVLTLGRPVADTLLQYCGFTHQTTQAELASNKNCRCDHSVLQRIEAPRPLVECSPSELAGTAGHDGGSLAGVSFTLDALSYVESAVCRCDSHQVDLFMTMGESLPSCGACGEAIVPQPFFTHRATPGHLLNARRDRPLRALGAEQATWAVVRRGASGALIREQICKEIDS